MCACGCNETVIESSEDNQEGLVIVYFTTKCAKCKIVISRRWEIKSVVPALSNKGS